MNHAAIPDALKYYEKPDDVTLFVMKRVDTSAFMTLFEAEDGADSVQNLLEQAKQIIAVTLQKIGVNSGISGF
jgi:hypothetical protein